MNFAQPYWLIAGLIACLFLIWRYQRFNRSQKAALARFVSPRLAQKLTESVSPGRRRIKQALFVAGVACLCIALARPQAGYRWQEVHRKGVELLMAVDTSKSMLTQDVKPNRLGRAKLAVDDLVNNLNGDGVGLLAFAGDSFLQCPITLDYDAFRESLDSLDTTTIPRGGTDIGGAIRESQAVLDARPAGDKILVLITDGEDLGGDAVAAAQAAGKDGVKIFTVGVGTSAGELIPVPSDSGSTDFVKDSSGQFVKSRLDESTLKQISQATGGMYEPLGQQGQGLTEIYNRGLAPFTRHDLSSRQTKVYLEQFQWPLLAAMILFSSEMLIGTRKRRTLKIKVQTGEPIRTNASNWSMARVAIAGVLALVVLPAVTQASPGSAEDAYKKGDYSAAEKQYADTVGKDPKQPPLEFNLGSAAYKSADYTKAAAAFQNTLNTTEVPLQQSAYYNLGNTQFRLGQSTEKAKPQETIKTWQEAVKSYDAALQIKSDDADAKFNRDLVTKKLDQLQRQEQQKKDQQNQQDKNHKDQQNAGQSQNQSKPDQKNQGQQGQSQQNQNGQQNPQTAQAGSKDDQQKSRADQKPGQKVASQKAQPQPGKGADKPQPSQANQSQEPKPDAGKSGDASDKQSQNQQGQDDASEPREPGQMTKEEAKQLLDSQKGDEHNLPAAQLSHAPSKPQDNQPLKDW